VELRRCVNCDCFQTVGFQATDEQVLVLAERVSTGADLHG
jgi:hypothetical protein